MKQIGGGPIGDPILLVLDDVWSPGLELLIHKFMFKGSPGYKILVTSRFVSTAYQNVKLKLLNADDAKCLFCHSAFPPESNYPVVLAETMNKVVKACNGFPLALNVVGLSLRGKPEVTWKTTLDKWSKRQSNIFDSNTDLLNTLKTSLDALDEEMRMEMLKYGFLDLRSFPEDQRISATVLLDKWVELYDLDEDNMYTYNNLLELSIEISSNSSKVIYNLIIRHGEKKQVQSRCTYYNMNVDITTANIFTSSIIVKITSVFQNYIE